MNEQRWISYENNKSQNSMQWGQIVISSLATLIITVLAGVAIFYFTKQEAPAPRVYFEKVSSTAFSTDKIKTVIHSFKVWNEGDKEADDIQVAIVLPVNATIIEQKVETSLGLTIAVDVENIDSHTLLAKIPSLNPGETVTFAFLLGDTSNDSIDIEVRGKGFVGQERSITSPAEVPSTKKEFSTSQILAIILLIIIQISMLVFLYRFYKTRLGILRRLTGEPHFNNYGFRLLHMGKFQEAKKYIQLSIDKEPGPYALVHLGIKGPLVV